MLLRMRGIYPSAVIINVYKKNANTPLPSRISKPFATANSFFAFEKLGNCQNYVIRIFIATRHKHSKDVIKKIKHNSLLPRESSNHLSTFLSETSSLNKISTTKKVRKRSKNSGARGPRRKTPGGIFTVATGELARYWRISFVRCCRVKSLLTYLACRFR